VRSVSELGLRHDALVGLGQRRIVYTIVQKLPSESGGERRYRIKAADESCGL
jgi:hypothetical protein